MSLISSSEFRAKPIFPSNTAFISCELAEPLQYQFSYFVIGKPSLYLSMISCEMGVNIVKTNAKFECSKALT